MAYTQTDLDAINSLIAAGEGEVFINGKKVVYRSLDELLKIRSLIERDLLAAQNRKPPRAVRLNISKGV